MRLACAFIVFVACAACAACDSSSSSSPDSGACNRYDTNTGPCAPEGRECVYDSPGYCDVPIARCIGGTWVASVEALNPCCATRTCCSLKGYFDDNCPSDAGADSASDASDASDAGSTANDGAAESASDAALDADGD